MRSAEFAAAYFATGEPALVTRARQKALLETAAAALRRAMAGAGGPARRSWRRNSALAAHALGRLLGRVDVEDILDKIFRDFCIGK